MVDFRAQLWNNINKENINFDIYIRNTIQFFKKESIKFDTWVMT